MQADTQNYIQCTEYAVPLNANATQYALPTSTKHIQSIFLTQ